MSGSSESLRRKLGGAGDLQVVVRSMKAMAASGISQYGRAAHALDDYYRTVELGLVACLQRAVPVMPARPQGPAGAVGAMVFGTDQGLVGQFNDVVAEFAAQTLRTMPGDKRIWAVGERVQARLEALGLPPDRLFAVPNSVHAITPLVGQLLVEAETPHEKGAVAQIYLFHNRPQPGAVYGPTSQRLLPLDATWQQALAKHRWPTNNLPEVVGRHEPTLRALLREYLFISLFRACAESLASENASRLAAMQRAEKNIGELLDDMQREFNRLRQNTIDEELFDVISGFEALSA